MKSKYRDNIRNMRKIARLEQKIQSLELARAKLRASEKGKRSGKVSRIFNFQIFGWKVTFVRHRRSESAGNAGTLVRAMNRFNQPIMDPAQTGQASQDIQMSQSKQTAQSSQGTNL